MYGRAHAPPPPAMIPPPFPFPERWQQVFRQRDARWLTPQTPLLCWVEAQPSVSTPMAVPTASTAPSPFWSPRHCAPPTHPPASFLSHVPEMPMRHPAASYERPPSCQPHQQAQWNAHAFTVENEASAVEVDAESDDAYEYAFVLSDEWRERFVRRRQAEAAAAPVAARDRRIKHGVPKQQRARRSTASRAKNEPSQSGTVNACGGLPARLDQERYESLNAEIAATGATEQARRARAAAAGYSKEGARAISHQEAQLNLRFDTFCDSSAPTLWPAG